ncbi:hypothetical protein PAXRUDRAFT_474057 [Paxillus rubicundulus Ve08.2h10]|uniref:Uncharacterized protein n=1 Tax=Paxillus rubicundulus Ve08.2h10 TaxID=930991 RepID=A0A0D0DPU3_9AGAM|nr:hypothetical protein PAXRUDRAFT_474057 [Paxillus rubicundulus Ve08.2h10]
MSQYEPACLFEGVDNPAQLRATYTEATMDFSSAKQLKISPYMRKRLILSAESLPDAIRGCDTYATQKVLRGPLALGLLRNAKWRQAPATDNQKAFIDRRRGKCAMDRGGVAERLTKGEAANIITRLKHGAHVCEPYFLSILSRHTMRRRRSRSAKSCRLPRRRDCE